MYQTHFQVGRSVDEIQISFFRFFEKGRYFFISTPLGQWGKKEERQGGQWQRMKLCNQKREWPRPFLSFWAPTVMLNGAGGQWLDQKREHGPAEDPLL